MAEPTWAIAEIRAHINDLDARLQVLEHLLSIDAVQRQPAQSVPLPAATSGVAIPRPHNGNGNFEDQFLRDVGLSNPELLERTSRLLQAEPVRMTDKEHAALLRVLEPYVQADHSSAPAARWTRTKLKVWIEAAGVGARPARARTTRS